MHPTWWSTGLLLMFVELVLEWQKSWDDIHGQEETERQRDVLSDNLYIYIYVYTYTLSQETTHILQRYPKQRSKILENSAHHQYQYKHKDGTFFNHIHNYTYIILHNLEIMLQRRTPLWKRYISKQRGPSTTEAEGLIDFLKTAGASRFVEG